MMKPYSPLFISGVLCALTAAACGGSEPSDAPAADTTLRADGSAFTRINASSKEEWVYFDLDDPNGESGEEMEGWDVAFQRQLIKLNGGANGDQDVAIAIVEGSSFSQVNGIPAAESFFTDTGTEEAELAMSQQKGWYNYNIIRHKLAPRDRVYVVRSSAGRHYKLKFESYYDDEGRGGFPSFVWSLVNSSNIIDTPDKECVLEEARREALGSSEQLAQGSFEVTQAEGGEQRWKIDASLGGTLQAAESSYLYLNLTDQKIIEVTDATSPRDARWQLAVKRSELRINSGDSGVGEVRLARVSGQFDAVARPSLEDETAWRTDDFLSDTCELRTFGLDFLDTAFGQWYDYNFEDHTVSVLPDEIYFLRDDAHQALWRLQILSYTDGVYELRVKPE